MHSLRWSLPVAIRRLRARYGKQDPPYVTDPFGIILWETCAYLVADADRKLVYDRLVAKTGGDPERIAAMKPAVLAALLAANGGMQPSMRADKVQRAANLAIDIGTAELIRLCRADPDKARRVLKKFPGVAEPGADRVLLMSAGADTLGLESNGLRVLQRLGFGEAASDYARTYRAVSSAVRNELPRSAPARIEAHQLLRLHGRMVCKTSAPRCGECPLSARCPSAN